MICCIPSSCDPAPQQQVVFKSKSKMKIPELNFMQAKPTDAEEIKDLVCLCYQKWIQAIGRKPLPMIADYFTALKSHRFELAYMQNTLIGVLELIEREDHHFIENVCVHPNNQRLGIGKKLIERAEEYALKVGCGKVMLATNKAFSGNPEFYLALGYKIATEKPFKGGVAILFEKIVINNSAM